jgi:DNA-binding MarR family transcriptional regulator
MSEQSKALREAMRQIDRRLEMVDEKEKACCCGTTLAQCHALVEIGRAGSISLIRLSEQMDLDKSTMSRTVDALVARGFAQRDIDEDNRRFVTIVLTEKGLEEYHAIESSMDVYFARLLDAVPAEKRAQVLESMLLLLEAVKQVECCAECGE